MPLNQSTSERLDRQVSALELTYRSLARRLHNAKVRIHRMNVVAVKFKPTWALGIACLVQETSLVQVESVIAEYENQGTVNWCCFDPWYLSLNFDLYLRWITIKQAGYASLEDTIIQDEIDARVEAKSREFVS